MIKLKDPRPFSIWTKKYTDASPATDAPAAESTDSASDGELINLGESSAFTLWTTIDGLAAAAARWIPKNSTSDLTPIPSNLSSDAEEKEAKSDSAVDPFPDSDDKESSTESGNEKETISATQNEMDPKPIVLKEAKSFTLSSNPDTWKPNLVCAKLKSDELEDAGEAAAEESTKEREEPKVAALADTSEGGEAQEPALATAGDGDGGEGKSADWWRMAFILAAVLGLGIIANQMVALGKERNNVEREKENREKVAGDLDKKVKEANSLSEELTTTQATAEALGEEKSQLEKEMEKANAEISAKTEEIAKATTKIGDMEKALTTAEEATPPPSRRSPTWRKHSLTWSQPRAQPRRKPTSWLPTWMPR